jgi:hypothetical protein
MSEDAVAVVSDDVHEIPPGPGPGNPGQLVADAVEECLRLAASCKD